MLLAVKQTLVQTLADIINFQGKAGVPFNFPQLTYGTHLTITQNTDDPLIALVDSPRVWQHPKLTVPPTQLKTQQLQQ